MKKYYRYSPRGFSNEYFVFFIEVNNDMHIEKLSNLENQCKSEPNPWIEQITRKEAEYITSNNRKMYRNGTANYCNPAGATEIVSIDEVLE